MLPNTTKVQNEILSVMDKKMASNEMLVTNKCLDFFFTKWSLPSEKQIWFYNHVMKYYNANKDNSGSILAVR